jgi:Domain of unknown function (DUF4218)
MMHIEKNVCETGMGTLCNIEGKSKDTLNTLLDLRDLGIRKDLHPYKEGDKYIYSIACYTLSKEEKMLLCKFLKELKMPDGYASNIRRCIQVEECTISGLKTHDCHVIFQQLLPLAIRELLPKKVSQPLIELSKYFLKLCSKELYVEELDELSRQIGVILCKLEQVFPPAFFTVMVHLPIHLAHEAKLAGPVIYRWMYMVERFLRTLKGYVKNKTHPEGSIAKGYIIEECMIFCSRFMKDIDTKLTRPQHHATVPRTEAPFELGLFGSVEGNQQGCQLVTLSKEELCQVHYYVLTNCEGISLWIE